MDYSQAFTTAFANLAKGVLVIGAYHAGNMFCKEYTRLAVVKNYLRVIVLFGVISLFVAAAAGTHIEDSEPLTGGGGTVVVDREMSKAERQQHGLAIFLSLTVPGLFGAYKKMYPFG